MADDLSGITALASVGVAALGVIFGPLTARLSYSWARKTEADRSNRERAAEQERWDRQEAGRRVQRGEDAAKEILTLVDSARLLLTDYSKTPTQIEFERFYHDIRRLAELLTDDTVRDRIFEVSDAIFYYHQADEVEPNLTRWSVGGAYADAAHQVLRAYLHSRPCPDTARLARLTELIRRGGERISEEIDDEGPDPLDEPQVEADVFPTDTDWA